MVAIVSLLNAGVLCTFWCEWTGRGWGRVGPEGPGCQGPTLSFSTQHLPRPPPPPPLPDLI